MDHAELVKQPPATTDNPFTDIVRSQVVIIVVCFVFVVVCLCAIVRMRNKVSLEC